MSREFDQKRYDRYKEAIWGAIADAGRVEGEPGSQTGVTMLSFGEASMAAAHLVAWLAVLNLGEGKVTEEYMRGVLNALTVSVRNEMLRCANSPRPPSLGSLQ